MGLFLSLVHALGAKSKPSNHLTHHRSGRLHESFDGALASANSKALTSSKAQYARNAGPFLNLRLPPVAGRPPGRRGALVIPTGRPARDPPSKRQNREKRH